MEDWQVCVWVTEEGTEQAEGLLDKAMTTEFPEVTNINYP